MKNIDHSTTAVRYMYWYVPFIGGLLLALVVGALWLGDKLIAMANAATASQQTSELNDLQAQEQALRREMALLRNETKDRFLSCKKEPESPPQPVISEPLPDPLSIPKDTKATRSMDFMEGCWTWVSKRTRAETHEPIEETLCFTGSGSGTDEVAEANRLCRGKAMASLDERGELDIKITKVKCEDGSDYEAESIHCIADENGKAACLNIRQDGSKSALTLQRK